MVEMNEQEACERLDNIAYQRENNAVLVLDLDDCKAIRILLDAVGFNPEEHSEQ